VTARPARVVFVAGTTTDVGKTWVAAAVLGQLRAGGHRVAARKPAQSFDTADACTDADVLAAATGESPHDVCPPHRWYPRPLAPPMAAEVLGEPAFTVSELLAELRWPDGAHVGVVEGAGGPRSPLATDGDNVDVARGIAPDLVLLVADAGLGAINAVRMSVDAFAGLAVVVTLNRYDDGDPLHRRNRHWLADHDGFVVVTDCEHASRRILT
jgi:dethiobiotin synthetase